MSAWNVPAYRECSPKKSFLDQFQVFIFLEIFGKGFFSQSASSSFLQMQEVKMRVTLDGRMRSSVTSLGYYLKAFETNSSNKSCPTIERRFGLFWKPSKNGYGNFLGKFWGYLDYFLFYHLVALMRSKDEKEMKIVRKRERETDWMKRYLASKHEVWWMVSR